MEPAAWREMEKCRGWGACRVQSVGPWRSRGDTQTAAFPPPGTLAGIFPSRDSPGIQTPTWSKIAASLQHPERPAKAICWDAALPGAPAVRLLPGPAGGGAPQARQLRATAV